MIFFVAKLVVSIMALDDGELDFSNHGMFLGSNVGGIPNGGSMTSFFDDIFNDARACTHTHTCNPPGPVSSHTHICYHVHTKIIPPMSNDDKIPADDAADESSEKKGKQHSKGNKDAVKKYRDKKKARAASLEDEVVRLRAINQQLIKRVQSQLLLETELRRLKSLLADTRGRIDGELGLFPYQKQNPVNPNLGGELLLNTCDMQRTTSMHHDPHIDGCDLDLECIRNQGSILLKEVSGCGANKGLVIAKPSCETKRKGT